MDFEITTKVVGNTFQCSVVDSDIKLTFTPYENTPDIGGYVSYGPLNHPYLWLISGQIHFEFFDMINQGLQVACIRLYIAHVKETMPDWAKLMFRR